jgi:hypothetical protein
MINIFPRVVSSDELVESPEECTYTLVVKCAGVEEELPSLSFCEMDEILSSPECIIPLLSDKYPDFAQELLMTAARERVACVCGRYCAV